MPEINVNRCIASAKVFMLEGKVLLDKKQDGQAFLEFLENYIAPCAANLAFSCELFLKALIAQENNGIIQRGHKLMDLYYQLDPVTRYIMRVKYNSYKPVYDPDKPKSPRQSFDDCLATHNEAFREWRYYFEAGKTISVEPTSLMCLTLSAYETYEEMYN